MNTFIQRLLAETSPWFKKAQVGIGLLLIVAFSLKAYIPAPILADILKIGITAIIGAACTVKDGTILAKDGFTLQSALEIIATFPDQLAELKQGIQGTLTLDQAKTIAGIQGTTAAPTIKVQAAADISKPADESAAS